MTETTILIITFFAVLLLSAALILIISSRRELKQRLNETDSVDLFLEGDIQNLVDGRLTNKQAKFLSHYFSVVRNDSNANSVSNRLIRAGYFSPSANSLYQLFRALFALSTMILAYFIAYTYFESLSRLSIMILSMMVGGFSFVSCNVFLERIGDRKESLYRRLFPDFMDMLITCVDAGLSIEAAISRVAREFLVTHPDFGLHLTIMTLEIRGGRRVRDALSNLGDRLHIDEAKSLAILFRQSEELGASVTKSLRVYSKEMRELRIIRAEEKANSLPIKMLFPMAISLFPVSLIMVLTPLLIRIAAIFKGIGAPGG